MLVQIAIAAEGNMLLGRGFVVVLLLQERRLHHRIVKMDGTLTDRPIHGEKREQLLLIDYGLGLSSARGNGVSRFTALLMTVL